MILDEPSGDLTVIGLVCSAGGLEALRRVLQPLPPDLPAAVIALQHHSPDAPSALARLLASRTALDVVTATDGHRLRPAQVVVAPPGRHTLVKPDLSLTLIESGPLPPSRPSADLLLTSLALAAGPKAIAVVLSGNGTDAATGATAVHHLGGTVIAASPQTSTHPGMPRATIHRDTITDHVTDLDDLAALLTTLTTPAVLGQ